MGKLITFWSPFTGHAKVTATICAVATAFCMRYPELEVALSHTKTDSTDLEERMDYCLDFKGKKELYEKTGMAALTLNYMQAALTPEIIRRCAIPMLLKSMYLFPGIGKKVGMESIQYNILTEKLVQEFDMTFLDLESGQKETSFQFMQAADIVVIVLPQRPVYWDVFFQEYAEKFKGKEMYFIIGGYLKASKYSVTYFIRKKEYGNRGKLIGTVPISAGYMDAMADGRTIEFFLKNELVRKKEENYEFMDQTKRTAEYLKKYAGGENGRKILFC